MTKPSDSIDSRLWRTVDQNTDDAVRYLELLTSLMGGFKRETSERLNLAPGQRVLEVGCGVGRDAECLVELVAPGGQVVAIDLSAELIAQATDRVAPLGLALEFRVADAQNLPFADAEFDAARIERTLQHLADPARAVREMVRVVRPGGRVVAFEPDWETLCAAGGSVATLRALRRHRVDVATPHGGIGRETPHLFQLAGCRDIKADGVVLSMQALGVADTVLGLAACLDGAIEDGLVSEADARAWWDEATARNAAGSFYASLNATIVSATVA